MGASVHDGGVEGMGRWALLVVFTFSFVIWTEIAPVPPGRRDLLVVVPSQRFEFPTFEDCRDARDTFLLLLRGGERISGCDESTERGSQ